MGQGILLKETVRSDEPRAPSPGISKHHCLNTHKANPNRTVRNCKTIVLIGDLNLLVYKLKRQTQIRQTEKKRRIRTTFSCLI